jgi:hypothetical protein
MHKVGNYYVESGYGETYLLAIVGVNGNVNKIALINIESGNRWHEPVEVKSTTNLLDTEVKEVFGERVIFAEVSVSFTVTPKQN